MGLPRSTFYDAPSVAVDDTEIVSRMQAICDEFETYGYRRVGATPVGGSVRRRVGGASPERVPLQQRPDEPQRQQPSDPERRDRELPPQPGEPGQAGRPDRRRGRRARQREQRTRQGALQHAREYRTELRDAIVVAAHLIDDADPSRDEVRRKNEEDNPQYGQDVRSYLYFRHFRPPISPFTRRSIPPPRYDLGLWSMPDGSRSGRRSPGSTALRMHHGPFHAVLCPGCGGLIQRIRSPTS